MRTGQGAARRPKPDRHAGGRAGPGDRGGTNRPGTTTEWRLPSNGRCGSGPWLTMTGRCARPTADELGPSAGTGQEPPGASGASPYDAAGGPRGGRRSIIPAGPALPPAAREHAVGMRSGRDIGGENSAGTRHCSSKHRKGGPSPSSTDGDPAPVGRSAATARARRSERSWGAPTCGGLARDQRLVAPHRPGTEGPHGSRQAAADGSRDGQGPPPRVK